MALSNGAVHHEDLRKYENNRHASLCGGASVK